MILRVLIVEVTSSKRTKEAPKYVLHFSFFCTNLKSLLSFYRALSLHNRIQIHSLFFIFMHNQEFSHRPLWKSYLPETATHNEYAADACVWARACVCEPVHVCTNMYIQHLSPMSHPPMSFVHTKVG